ncbi:hypothetical protein HMPREF0648_1357, partial [Prevotella bivia JCVIHMP010]
NLTCFNKNGLPSGIISFAKDKVGLSIEGDIFLYIPRTRSSRRLKNTLYADDIVTIGSFGHFKKIVAVVTNRTMVVYHPKMGEPFPIELEKSPDDSKTYLIPLCWGTIKFPAPKEVENTIVAIDVVVFKCDGYCSYSFSNLENGKEWTVINGNNEQSIGVHDISGLYLLQGGVTCKYVYVDPYRIRLHGGNQLAPGVFRSGSADLNWK